MKIVYNPPDGAPIKSFIYNGMLVDPHFPDGARDSNGLVQYDDETGEAILETYEFLTEVSKEKAEELLATPQEPKFKCDFPGCDYAARIPVALSSHKRKHAKETANLSEALIDPAKIPVAGGKKVFSIAERQKMADNDDNATRNGTDRDGVEWYGEGVVKENQGFDSVRKTGKGHFQG